MPESEELTRRDLRPLLVVGQRGCRDHGNAVLGRCQRVEVDGHVVVDQMRLRKRCMAQDVAEIVGAMREEVLAVRKQVIEAAVTCDFTGQLTEGGETPKAEPIDGPVDGPNELLMVKVASVDETAL